MQGVTKRAITHLAIVPMANHGPNCKSPPALSRRAFYRGDQAWYRSSVPLRTRHGKTRAVGPIPGTYTI